MILPNTLHHSTPHKPLDTERFTRQIFMPDIGLEGQIALRNTRVFVAGCGALGSVCAWYCSALGVGSIALADDDTVALHNLHRQTLYMPHECGLRKTDVLCNRLQEFAPAMSITTHPALTPHNAHALLSGCDYVIDGTDNFPAKFLLNDVCHALHIPLVYGSVYRLDAQCALLDMQNATLRTIFPHEPEDGSVPDCAGSGTVGTVTSMVALWQVHLLMAHRLQWQPSNANRLFLWNMNTMQQTSVALM